MTEHKVTPYYNTRDGYSIKFRLVVLILAAILPAIIYIIHTLFNNYSQSKQYALDSLAQRTEMFSVAQGQSVEAARQLLVSFSNNQDVVALHPFACNTFFKKQISGYTRYANFGVADTNGNIVCSAVTTPHEVTIKNEPYFKGAVQTKAFTSGTYRVSTITEKSVLDFAYPLVNDTGTLLGVVFASLDLSWQNTFLEHLTDSPKTILLVVDKDATILSRNVDANLWVGKTFPQDPLVQEVLQKGEGTTETVGLDGIRRLYSFKKLPGTDTNPSYVIIGIPLDIVYHDANIALTEGLFALGLLVVLIGYVSSKIGSFLIIKRVEELEELDRLKSEFVSIASHQLRTPLSAIKWFSEIVSDEGGLNSMQQHALKRVGESNERMINLVNSLLDVSKIEAKKLKSDIQPTSLAEIIHALLPEVTLKAQQKKQNLEIHIPNDLPKVLADGKLMTQVYLNVIHNAIKYTPDKGTISLSLFNEDGWVISTIKDNGPGIPEKEQAHLFQKFFRGTKASKEHTEGSGLGLFIAKSMVEDIGGTIRFESTIGKGTTFVISLRHAE